MAAVAKNKPQQEKCALVKGFAQALVLPRRQLTDLDIVPAVSDEATRNTIGWPGLIAFIKFFLLNDSLPESGAGSLGEATSALKVVGVERGPSNKGVHLLKGKGGLEVSYKPRNPGCAAVYYGRLPNPDDDLDVASLTKALKGVPDWALRAPGVSRENLAQKVVDGLRAVTLVTIPPTFQVAPSSSSSSTAPQKKVLRAVGDIERDENHPRSIERPLNMTSQMIKKASNTLEQCPQLSGMLVGAANCLMRTELGKHIYNTDTRLLSPNSKKAKLVLIGAPVLAQLQENNEQLLKNAAAAGSVPPSSPL
jgi:hypothetical protein